MQENSLFLQFPQGEEVPSEAHHPEQRVHQREVRDILRPVPPGGREHALHPDGRRVLESHGSIRELHSVQGYF